MAAGSSALPLLLAGQIVGGFAGAAADVDQWSQIQLVTPNRLQARVTAGHRCLVSGAQPRGALAGDVLAPALGIRPALAVAAAAFLVPLALLATPLIRPRSSHGLAASAAD